MKKSMRRSTGQFKRGCGSFTFSITIFLRGQEHSSRKRTTQSSFYLSVGKPFPAVCIRTSTERPEALDRGCFVLAGIHTEQLLQSIDLAVGMQQNGDLGTPVPDYTAENVSMKVVRLIQSYTGVVNKTVWRKNG